MGIGLHTAVMGIAAIATISTTASASPWAAEVVDYQPGVGSDPGYDNPATALGEPSRFTPDPLYGYDSVVSVFSPPFQADQVVSIGDGGGLTVRFDELITNDAAHLYGVDFIVFGNAGFQLDFANYTATNPAALLGRGNGRIEVSDDGVTFYEIPGVRADQLFPSVGYLDSGMFDPTPGQVPSDFRKPVNPALGLSAFDGLTYEQILALYDGSGGGLGVDIATAVDGLGQPAGLTEVRYVRVSHSGADSTDIDGFAIVPEPAAMLLLAAGGVLGFARRRGRRCATALDR